MSDQYAEHAHPYLPGGRLRILFVAEAPPNSADRYFYFEDVKRDDWLWIALMKGLYPDQWRWGRTKEERKCKKIWLQRFRDSGFCLIDAVKKPISNKSQAVSLIRQSALENKIIEDIRTRFKPRCIVLIKATVYDALFEEFRAAGLPVANREALPFPAFRWQTEFHEKLSSLDCVKEFIRERESENWR
jgi:hypothetical protein